MLQARCRPDFNTTPPRLGEPATGYPKAIISPKPLLHEKTLTSLEWTCPIRVSPYSPPAPPLSCLAKPGALPASGRVTISDMKIT